MIGSTNTKQFSNFQIRWREKLGLKEDPYLIRWTFIIFGFSIRVHHWIRSDDNRFFHDHSSNLLSIVLKGRYWNVKPIDVDKIPNDISINPYNIKEIEEPNESFISLNQKFNYVEGIFNSFENFKNMKKSIWFSEAEDRHWLKIPKGGAWTLMFEGFPYNKWGFYVNGKKWRPLRYFSKYGIKQTSDYQ